jgi:hypothetical protein
MPAAEVVETVIADAPPKTPVDVIKHEAEISDFATYKAAKEGKWQPKQEKEAEAKTETETPTETEQVSEGENPSSEAEAQADSEAEAEQTTKTQEEAEGKGKNKPNPIAPRIGELTKQRNLARDENAKLKARIEELEKLPQAVPIPDNGEPKKPTRPKTPDVLDPALSDPAKYREALAKYDTDMDAYETAKAEYDHFTRQKTEQESAMKRALKARAERFITVMNEAVEKNRFGENFKPFAEPNDGGPPTSKLMADIMPNLEDPAIVANFLAHNPKFAEKLHDIYTGPPEHATHFQRESVAYLLGKIEGRLLESEKSGKAAEPPAEIKKPPEKPATPQPARQKTPVTLSGSGEPPIKDLNDADEYEEYQRLKKSIARRQ